MTKADAAQVAWDTQKKRWVVRIRVGEETVKRPCSKSSHDIDEQALQRLAIETARDDGYDLDPATVSIAR